MLFAIIVIVIIVFFLVEHSIHIILYTGFLSKNK